MQRDVRRGRGQWRGCHTFRDIICDDAPGPGTPYKRHGGLKMGHTYYYYYEVDSSIETHNPSLPSTTSCPYMPGQSVNTMIIPVEQALRQRSASLTSMRQTDFKTMDPDSKFSAPRPVLSGPENPTARLGTSPMLNHKHSTGSLSTTPAWKRFFTRKLNSRDGERGRSPARDANTFDGFGSRCTTPSEGTRTRDISPESLRRFLSDDIPSRPGSNLSVRPTLVIPEDIPEDKDNEVDNDNDDDDNFATSAVSETQTYATRLSPPPCRRTASCESMNLVAKNSSAATLKPPKPSRAPVYETQEAPASAVIPSRPRLGTLTGPRHLTAPGYFMSPISSQYPDDESHTYCLDLTDDEDDVISNNNSDILCGQPATSVKVESYECYSLPESEGKGRKMVEPQSSFAKINDSPAIGSCISVSGSNLLDTPINHGLDDFVSELGWIAEMIGNKRF